MLNSLLDIVEGWKVDKTPNNYYFTDYGEAAMYALIGFVLVFVGIVIIIGVIWLVGLLMRKTDNLAFLSKKRRKNKPVEEKKPVAEEQTSETDEIPDEVKAAIVAAIMAYYQEKEEKCQFTVKRIKRI